MAEGLVHTTDFFLGVLAIQQQPLDTCRQPADLKVRLTEGLVVRAVGHGLSHVVNPVAEATVRVIQGDGRDLQHVGIGWVILAQLNLFVFLNHFGGFF